MLFNSVGFMLFFPIACLLYFIFPNKIKNMWLLLGSYFFYMCWNAKYGLLLLGMTLITYVGGLLIGQTESSGETQRRAFRLRTAIAVSVIVMGTLFLFKYLNFSISVLGKLLEIVGVQLSLPRFDIILPVGISFFAFQALGYTLDVYRGTQPPEKNFVDYALFVSFFPQLVAGPIERSGAMLSQLKEPHHFDYDRMREGILLMLWGYFLKLVLADRIAIFVDTVYGNPEHFGGAFLITATILFAFQIYCDFYGYSIIAMGAAKVLGIQLSENFDAPYLSLSAAEFWRHWHMTLTSWFTDYVYIPLGGSRKGTLRRVLNIMIVFLLSGLWHGARLSFVVWGGLNGFYQVIGILLKPLRDKGTQILHVHRDSFGHKLLQGLITFILVDFAWIFFRAEGVRNAVSIIHSMVSIHNPWILTDGSIFTCGLGGADFIVLAASLGILLFADVMKKRKHAVRSMILRQDWWFRALVIVISTVGILTFGIWGPGMAEGAFIYFQF